jgi:phosphoribosylanthranilate isomerase
VFRDESPRRVVESVRFAGLKAAQLHGREPPEQARWVRERVPFVIQAFAAGDRMVTRARDYGVNAVLIDNPTPGSGQVFDWALVGEAPDGVRVIVAGGLTPDNVGGAVAAVRPWGVDVVSGVEREPGHKDPARLRAFVAAAKAAEESPYQGDVLVRPYDWEEES